MSLGVGSALLRRILGHASHTSAPVDANSNDCNKSSAATYHEQRRATPTVRSTGAPYKEQKMQAETLVVQRQNGPGLLVRALYFILFGWWFSGIWAVVAWILCLTIIGLP